MQPGDVLRNRYRIVRPLGTGGFAEVCLAEDLYFQREVAVKRLAPGALLGAAGSAIAPSPEQRNQFLEEARLLARVSHPNLPKIVDFFEDGASAAIVMDYIAGETLEAIVERRGALPQNEVLGWARQVCDTLAYLHALSPPVIVRDLKPDNLILAYGRLYLIDFGIAKEGGAATVTRTVNRAVGTPGYCPPEQYGAAHRPSGTCPQSDYYALGATLVFLFTGTVAPDVMERIAHAVPLPEVTKVNPSVTARVQDAIRALMELDVSRRPATVDQVRGLLGLSGSTSPLTRPASVSGLHVVPSVVSRSAPHVPTGISVAVLIAGVLGVFLFGGASSPNGGETGSLKPSPASTAPVWSAPPRTPAGAATSRATTTASSPSRALPSSPVFPRSASPEGSVTEETATDASDPVATPVAPSDRQAPAASPEPSGESDEAHDAGGHPDASGTPVVPQEVQGGPTDAGGSPASAGASDGAPSNESRASATSVAPDGESGAPAGAGGDAASPEASRGDGVRLFEVPEAASRSSGRASARVPEPLLSPLP